MGLKVNQDDVKNVDSFLKIVECNTPFMVFSVIYYLKLRGAMTIYHGCKNLSSKTSCVFILAKQPIQHMVVKFEIESKTYSKCSSIV